MSKQKTRLGSGNQSSLGLGHSQGLKSEVEEGAEEEGFITVSRQA